MRNVSMQKFRLFQKQQHKLHPKSKSQDAVNQCFRGKGIASFVAKYEAVKFDEKAPDITRVTDQSDVVTDETNVIDYTLLFIQGYKGRTFIC